MDWKETVTTMSEKVFPGISCKTENLNFNRNEVLSSLPLQMSLYFNVIFFPFWIVIMLIFIIEKLPCFNELYKFLIITVVVTILIIEILRLYLGYEGNLKDKIPELAGFWMLSILLQLPLQSFLLMNPFFNLNVVEFISQSLMFIMLCIQNLIGYITLKNTSRKQAIYFRIMKLSSDARLSALLEKYKVS